MSKIIKKIDVLHFIELYKRHEVLWNMNHSSYRRNDLKIKAYESISTEMQMSVVEVKKKIKSLRTAYGAEKSKVEKSKISGCGTDSLYVPTVFWYKEMSFLDASFNRRTTADYFNPECEPKRKIIKPNSTDKMVRLTTQRLKSSEDSCQQIATVWASKLSKMDRNQRIFAEKVINEVLFNGELGFLNYSTTVANLNPMRNRNSAIINTSDSSQASHLTEYTLNYDHESNDEVTDQESVQSAENYIVEDNEFIADSVKLEY